MPSQRYGAVTQSLHWITAILVLAAFIYGPGGSEARAYSAAKDFERQLHETLGLCVLLLTVLRLAWRAVETRPEPPRVPAWMSLSGKLVQWSLYGMLFSVPITAIAGAWLEGHALTLLGGLEIAPLTAKSHAVGVRISKLHTWLGDAILWLAGFHAAAALLHHFVLDDGVLASMLPKRILRDRWSEQ
jgi:cytochrome b561